MRVGAHNWGQSVPDGHKWGEEEKGERWGGCWRKGEWGEWVQEAGSRNTEGEMGWERDEGEFVQRTTMTTNLPITRQARRQGSDNFIHRHYRSQLPLWELSRDLWQRREEKDHGVGGGPTGWPPRDTLRARCTHTHFLSSGRLYTLCPNDAQVVCAQPRLHVHRNPC